MALLQKKTLKEADVYGKRVLVRVDFNVPLVKATGEIADDKRIRAAIPSLEYLLAQEASLILITHLGRPKGIDPALSLAPVAARLAELMGREVMLSKDIVGEDARKKAAALQPGQILMLENIRFQPEETKNDRSFAKELASLGDVFINDAFGTAHRAHASTYGIARFLPSAAGFLIQKELDIIGGALAEPQRPFTAVIGGAKVSDKIGVIESLLEKVDNLLIGGAMAYTFLSALGLEVGTSLYEPDKEELALEIMEKAKEKKINLILPQDVVIAQEFSAEAKHKTVDFDQIEAGWMGMGIGPKTIESFNKIIAESKTIIWNGPLGVFEFPAFAGGTKKVAEAIGKSDAVSIIGGGDSASAVEQSGFAERVSHISTGGGASLELLEGKILPGIEALSNRDERRLLAAGNWKMNKGTPVEAEKFIKELLPLVKNARAELVLAVPFTALIRSRELTDGTVLALAAQNGHEKDFGAYTGEISMKMLADLNIPYVIVGHSERRQYFGESSEDVNAKAKTALSWGVFPIICVGESLQQRENGETFTFIRKQIRECFAAIEAKDLFRITIAYEPIWAIGTGKTATDEQAQEVCAFIRAEIKEIYGAKAADQIRILYGGSVNAENAAGLFLQPDVDGGLVGGASLKAADFSVIARADAGEKPIG